MSLFRKNLLIPKRIHQVLKSWSPAKKLVFAAILSVLTVMFQSAGGLLPGIGFAISPFSTMTVLFASIISLRHGFFTYISTMFLLILIEPSELFVFPFTTGLLGLAMGWTLRKFNKSIPIILINGLILLAGICIPLYGLNFPILGPMLSGAVEIKSLLIILVFSLIYSWLWLGLSLYFLARVNKALIGEK